MRDFAKRYNKWGYISIAINIILIGLAVFAPEIMGDKDAPGVSNTRIQSIVVAINYPIVVGVRKTWKNLEKNLDTHRLLVRNPGHPPSEVYGSQTAGTSLKEKPKKNLEKNLEKPGHPPFVLSSPEKPWTFNILTFYLWKSCELRAKSILESWNPGNPGWNLGGILDTHRLFLRAANCR